MVYLAFACAFAGLVFYKISSLALCTESIMAGISLLLPHFVFMDQQIKNLVPVLKSYCLNINVYFINAKFGFLCLFFLLVVVSLL
ncbi:hypothetical protein ACISMT_09210 [Campylobacter jejuni]